MLVQNAIEAASAVDTTLQTDAPQLLDQYTLEYTFGVDLAIVTRLHGQML